VEMIHDRLVAQLWPGTDPIQSDEPRDLGLLDSAVSSPFQSAFQQDIHSGTVRKGAALFRSLNGHCFFNGNKRTAVLALDIFFLANGYNLVLENDDMYKLAERTASYKLRGLSNDEVLNEIVDTIKDFTIPFETVEAEARNNPRFKALHENLLQMQAHIQSDKRGTR